MNKHSRLILFSFVALAFLLSAPGLFAAVVPAADLSAIGVNVGFIGSYMPMFPFNDRMKSAEPWQGNECQVWGVQAGTKGEYTLIYPGPTPTIVRGGTLAPISAGRWKLTANGGELKIRVADTTKLVQLLPAGIPESRGTELSDHFKKSKEPFGYIRLLDVTNANWAQGRLTAANRPKLTDQFWNTTRTGSCPLEPFIDYAAESGKVLYVNVPHTASDDWCVWLFKECAAKGVCLMLTFGNETWNRDTFAGGSMWPQKGIKVPDGGVPAQAGNLSVEAFTLKRCVEIGRLARAYMPPADVEVVWEIQIAAGADQARRAWNTVKPAPGDVQFIAGAPYQSDSTTSADPKVHAANYLAKAKRWYDGVGDTMEGMPRWVQLCKDTGTDWICYEFNNEPKLSLAGTALAAQRAAQDLKETGEAIGIGIDAQFKHGAKRVMMFVDFGPGSHAGESFNVWALERDHRPPFDSPASLAVLDRTLKYRVSAAPPPPPPDDDPTTKPTTQPTTKPTTQPTGLTFAGAYRLRNGPIEVTVSPDGVTVKIPQPSPVPDATFRFDAADAKRMP